jgi:hypothetical protein
MVNKDFTQYTEALDLKELGFDEPCFGYWYTEQEEFKKIDIQLSSIGFLEGEPDYILAPTYSQAFRWFREKHNLFGQVNIHTYFIYDISNDGFKIVKKYDKLFETYEETELACLEKLIEIVKEKQK